MSKTGLIRINKRRLEEGFRERGFDFADEFIKLFKESSPDIQTKLLTHIAEFLFPKRRAEDEEGKSEDLKANVLVVTAELLEQLVNKAK